VFEELANWELMQGQGLARMALVARRQWKDEVRLHHIAFVAATVGLLVD